MRTLLLALSIPLAYTVRQATFERAVFGRWRVSDSRCMSKCALSPAQAAAWRGRYALYSDSLVRVGNTACRRPRYTVGYWPATGTYGGERLTDFGIHTDSAQVVEVQCASEPHRGPDRRWPVWGAFLIVKDAGHLLVIWEGAVFALTRAR